jgi:hypothetical protein
MTLATPHPGRRSLPASDVFASGSSAGRRRLLVGAGLGLLLLAYVDWLIGELSPAAAGVTGPVAMVLGLLGLTVLTLAAWRRSRAHQVRSAGILLVSGGPIFGDRQLVPWSSITHFGGRRSGDDGVCLVFRQQHIWGEQKLPGRALTVAEYDRLIDRLRVVLGGRFPDLELGGLEG